MGPAIFGAARDEFRTALMVSPKRMSFGHAPRQRGAWPETARAFAVLHGATDAEAFQPDRKIENQTLRLIRGV
jgi:hypothetical protein